LGAKFSGLTRSELMSRIRSTGNKRTELRLIEIFRSAGITGWRRRSCLIGKPDFVFPQQKIAVFVDGCFWHGCPRHYKAPRTRTNFWKAKIERNRRRDRLVTRALRKLGWTVVRYWEHDIEFDIKASKAVAHLQAILAH
jgi:DNA mismatch endonuclease, patch repair protein